MNYYNKNNYSQININKIALSTSLTNLLEDKKIKETINKKKLIQEMERNTIWTYIHQNINQLKSKYHE